MNFPFSPFPPFRSSASIQKSTTTTTLCKRRSGEDSPAHLDRPPRVPLNYCNTLPGDDQLANPERQSILGTLLFHRLASPSPSATPPTAERSTTSFPPDRAAPSILLSPAESATTMASSSSNVVGVHYRVGKKIGEGSFGVIFEGTNLLNNQQVAIKFVSRACFPLLGCITPNIRTH